MKHLFLFLVFSIAALAEHTQVPWRGKNSGGNRYLSEASVFSFAAKEKGYEKDEGDEALAKAAGEDNRVGIDQGSWNDRVCKEAKDHSDWLASRNLPAHLPNAGIAHSGDNGRSFNLIGNMVGSRGFRSNRFEEIVSESLPGVSAEEGAKQCLDGWYNSPAHRKTLVSPSQYYCLTMSKSTNPANPRWYCVGLALYYGR